MRSSNGWSYRVEPIPKYTYTARRVHPEHSPAWPHPGRARRRARPPTGVAPAVRPMGSSCGRIDARECALRRCLPAGRARARHARAPTPIPASAASVSSPTLSVASEARACWTATATSTSPAPSRAIAPKPSCTISAVASRGTCTRLWRTRSGSSTGADHAARRRTERAHHLHRRPGIIDGRRKRAARRLRQHHEPESRVVIEMSFASDHERVRDP